MSCPTLPYTTVEDDPYIRPAPQLPEQLLVPAQTGAAHDKDEHAYVLACRSFEVIGSNPTDQPLDHSIRRLNSDCGMVSPSAVAVFRLMTDSEVDIIFHDGRGAAQRPRQSLSA